MALTSEQLAKSGSEHGHQAAFFNALKQDPRCPRSHPLWQLVVTWTHAIPNGGERDVITAGKLKAEGVKPGVFDICVPVPIGRHHGMYLEMKRPVRRTEKNGGVSDDQRKFGLAMHGLGYHTFVAYTWEEALLETIAYVEGRR